MPSGPTTSSEQKQPSQSRRLWLLLALNIALIAALLIAGLLAHSIGLLAAGGDFVADSLAIVLGLVAVHLRDKHGNAKAPTYVALINGSFLLVVTIVVLIESVRRLLTGVPEVAGLPMLIVSGASTLAMVGGALILGARARSEDLHMRSVLLDTLADALSAAGVAVVGGIIYFTHGVYWLDPVAAIVIGVVIGAGAIKLLWDVARSLREHTPLDFDD